MPIFGDPHMAMQAGAPPSMNPGMAPPDQGMMEARPQQPLPPGAGAAPDPAQQAMANQLYLMSQQIQMLQQELADLRGRKVNMDFMVQRDDDGRISSVTAAQGMG